MLTGKAKLISPLLSQLSKMKKRGIMRKYTKIEGKKKKSNLSCYLQQRIKTIQLVSANKLFYLHK